MVLSLIVRACLGVTRLTSRSHQTYFVDDHIGLRLAPNCSLSSTLREGERLVYERDDVFVIRSENILLTYDRTSNDACVHNAHFYPVHPRYTRYVCDDPYMVYQQYLYDVGVTTAWTSGGGENVSVIVVDDGILDHYDVRVDSRFWVADELYGMHGTSVAGVVTGLKNDRGICGVAPESRLVDINLLAQNFVSDIGEAMAFDNALHMQWNAVYCNSWGPTDDGRCEGPGIEVQAALLKGVTTGRGGRGCVYVFAAGNGGNNENMNDDGYANSIYTISVAALNGNAPAYFSEWGAGISISANGYQLLAPSSTNNFIYFYGTSASAPIVTGVIALMLSTNVDLGWRDVHEILMTSATTLDLQTSSWTMNPSGHMHNYAYGAGNVDAERAVNVARTWINLKPWRNASRAVDASMPLPALVGTPFEESFRVEHVRVCVSIVNEFMQIGYGSTVGVWLLSPSGTKSILTRPTTRVSVIAGCSYHDASRRCFSGLRTHAAPGRCLWRIRGARGRF